MERISRVRNRMGEICASGSVGGEGATPSPTRQPVLRHAGGVKGETASGSKTQLRPTLKRIDAYVIRWARRKFKRMRHQTKGGRDWFARLRRARPTLFAHWTL